MNSLTTLQEQLLARNIINLNGNVDSNMAEYINSAIMCLRAKDNPPITIYITSGGGDVDIGLVLYDLFRLYPGKKTGIVNGFARSMAAIILQACEARHCTRHSAILIHHIFRNSIGLDELRNQTKLKKIKNDLEKGQERIYEILSLKTKKDKTVLKKACLKDTDMTSEEAKDFGLIDEII